MRLPLMPRKALWILAVAVLALHVLLLQKLPLGGRNAAAPAERMAFDTRMVAPPPPAPSVEPAPPPPPAPKPPARKPRPQPPTPRPAPEPVPEPEPEPATEAVENELAPVPEPTGDPGQEDATAATATATAAESAPTGMPESAAPATPSETAPVSDSIEAGVDIRPPGATHNTAAGQVLPVRLPAPARLAFDVSGQVKTFHYRASAELLWQHDASHYEARQEIKAFLLGSRAQTSVGTVTEAGLQPRRFGDKSRSEQAAHFDFGQGKVIFSANTPQATITEGAQDRLSVFIQLGALLAAAPDRYPAGTQITLTTVGARNADRWTFTVEGEETLDLPIGPTPALKLQRLPRRERDQTAELWLGTSLDYLPVRIRLTQSGGDFADLSLSGHSAP